jgi:hypothetical protein
LPGAKPVMSPTTVVAPDGSSCVKVNVPATPAVPVRTTTAFCLFVCLFRIIYINNNVYKVSI